MTGEKYLVFLLKQLAPSIAKMEECLSTHSILSVSFLRYIKKKFAVYWLCCRKKFFVARNVLSCKKKFLV